MYSNHYHVKRHYEKKGNKHKASKKKDKEANKRHRQTETLIILSKSLKKFVRNLK